VTVVPLEPIDVQSLIACPWCGQRLANERAVTHLTRALKNQEKVVERAAKAAAKRMAEEQVQQLRETDAKKLAAEVDRREAAEKQLETQRERQRTQVAALRVRMLREAKAAAAKGVQSELRSYKATVDKLKENNVELERRMEKLTAPDRGKFSEDDLERELRQQFPEDRIERRGRGGDVLHHIYYRAGAEQVRGGAILYENKDTLSWQNEFARKAKADGVAQKTPYVVVVSKAFPRNQRNLCFVEGVAVAHPGTVGALASLLRRMIIEVHRAGLTRSGEAKKTEELFRYLTGNDFRQVFDAVLNASHRFKQLLEKERKAHHNVWEEREDAYNDLMDKTAQIDGRMRKIIENRAPMRAKLVSLHSKTGDTA